jgi:hypothetical protein
LASCSEDKTVKIWQAYNPGESTFVLKLKLIVILVNLFSFIFGFYKIVTKLETEARLDKQIEIFISPISAVLTTNSCNKLKGTFNFASIGGKIVFLF